MSFLNLADTAPEGAPGSTMRFKVLTVTPEMASRWLSNNKNNRPIQRKHVIALADVMTKGLWSLNGETVCFDADGRLLDGQHRLRAICLAGEEVAMTVVVGVADPHAFETYDSLQKVRSAGQIAQLKGLQNANAIVASARVVKAWEDSQTIEIFSNYLRSDIYVWSPHEITEKAIEIAGEYAEAKDAVGNSMAVQSRAKPNLLAMIIILMRIDKESSDDFFDKVKSGIIHKEGDPALACREMLMTKNSRGITPRKFKETVMALTIKAWNYSKKSKKITLKGLTYSIGDRFPTPIGCDKK